MQLATKLTVGVVVTSALVIGASGIEQLRREDADLRKAASHELRVLAAALEVAAEKALRDHQGPDIQAILDGIEIHDPSIDVFVFDAGAAITQQSIDSEARREVVEPLVREAAAHSQPVMRFIGDLEYLAVAQPLRADDETRFGVLALAKPLDQVQADLTTTRNAILVSFVTQLAAISVVAWLLVSFWMRRPLANVARGMRAVRAGDLSARIPAASRDEVGDLAREFNAMATELDTIRGALAAETESRRSIEQGLQQIDKLVTVGQLSAGLAHEIGSPLQILNGRARALLERGDASPEVKRQAGIIVAQSERVTRIVEQLLTYARRSTPRMADIDVRGGLQAVLDLLAGEARKRQVALEFVCDPDLPTVRTDADRIQQIALNLLSNALKATPEGGHIRLRLQAARFRHAKGTPERAAVVLVVEDDGIGMHAEAVARAFEPFFTSWPDSHGTGLGLAVVKAIVDDHGGMIALESTPGVGTRVEIHLPRGDGAVSDGAVPA